MELSSESRRLGRRRAFSERELSAAEGQESALSRRQLQNRAYAERARRCLAELCWWQKLTEGISVPQSVLAELGRIEDREEFSRAAVWYWESGQKLTVKNAATIVRRMRTGSTPQEGPTTLYECLMKTIHDFRISYPDASVLYLEGQIKLALEAVRYYQRCRY